MFQAVLEPVFGIFLYVNSVVQYVPSIVPKDGAAANNNFNGSLLCWLCFWFKIEHHSLSEPEFKSANSLFCLSKPHIEVSMI